MAKKGLDFKALLLNHGEKFGAAVVGLLAVTGLATANWSGCSRLEAEMKDAATKTRDAWNSPANTLPEEKKALFAATPDVEALAQRMASPNEDIEKFTTVRHWNEPINQVREKLGAVVVLPPESPESTLVSFTLVEKDDEAETEETTTETEMTDEKKPAEDQELADLFGKNNSAGALPGGVAGLPGEELLTGGVGTPGAGNSSGIGGYSGAAGSGIASMAGEGTRGSGMMGAGMLGAGMAGSGMMDSLDGYGGAGYGGMEFGTGASVEKKVRSCAGISVRCVFDLYRQTNMLAEALHLPPQEVSQRYIDFVNLEIQRKAAVSGPDQWVGEWEDLPLKDIAEILEQSAYFDRDIVNPSVVRSEITMPLPSRAAGNWTAANASHKRLEKFELSEEEKDLIDKHQAKLLEEANKLKAMLPPAQAKSEGFRKYTLASQDLGMVMGGNTTSMSGEIFSDYQEDIAAGDGEAAKKKDPRFKSEKDLEKFLNDTLVANRLLLVRFMDFTCDRGNAYQYRVRLEMRNPNFNVPVDELEQPELASQRTVFSDWSAPTAPVFVPGAYRYYTQKVESKPRSEELAHLSMLYQHETAGTPVMASLRVPVGVRIGGKQILEVVDLGKSKLESQEVELRSQDFLAGVAEAPRITPSDFPELKDVLKSTQRTRPIPDRITVVDSTGAIVSRFVGDKVASGEKMIAESDDMALAKYVLDQYAHLRPQEVSTDVANSPYGEAGSDSASMGMASMPGMGGGMGSEYGGAAGRSSALGNSGGKRSRKGKGGSSAPASNPNR